MQGHVQCMPKSIHIWFLSLNCFEGNLLKNILFIEDVKVQSFTGQINDNTQRIKRENRKAMPQ